MPESTSREFYDKITSLFLYGESATPSNIAKDAYLPPEQRVLNTVNIGASDLMSGPGRFAVPVFFEVVQRFFEDDFSQLYNAIVASGKWNFVEGGAIGIRKSDLLSVLGVSGVLAFNQAYFDDGADDYASRVFFWSSTAFQLSNDTMFVIGENGEREIRDLAVEPLRADAGQGSYLNDNFDWAGGAVAELAEGFIRPLIDPFGIGDDVQDGEGGTPSGWRGRDVDILIGGTVPGRSTPFTQLDYANGLTNAPKSVSGADLTGGTSGGALPFSSLDLPAIALKLQAAGDEFVADLYDRGIINYQQDGYDVFYGNSQDNVIALDGSYQQLLAAYPHLAFGGATPKGAWVLGGEGADLIRGMANEANKLVGGGGSDNLYGGEKDDELYGDAGADELRGGGGDDKFFGDANDTVLDGGEGYDTLDYSGSIEQIEWLRILASVSDVEVVIGSEHDDSLDLLSDNRDDIDTTIDGADGDDEVGGNGGKNLLYGGTGDDYVHGDSGNDTLYGGDGDDRLVGGAPSYWLASDDDRLFGDGGNDNIDGGGGDDYVRGGSGSDFMDGGAGHDTVDLGFDGRTSGVTMALNASEFQDPDYVLTLDEHGQVDRMTHFEEIRLTNYSDKLVITDLGPTSLFGGSPMGDLKIDFAGAPEPAFGDDALDFSAIARTVTDYSLFGANVLSVKVGVRVDLTDRQNQTVDYLYTVETPLGGFSMSNTVQHELVVANANSVIGTSEADWIKGGRGKEGSGEGYSTLKGGGGNDSLTAAGWESHLYGGEGRDLFAVASNTHVEDAEAAEITTYGDIQLTGGVKQWWMEGLTAYAAQFSTFLTVLPVVGSELLYTASFFIDTAWMKFASYQVTEDNTLKIDLGWGQAGTAAVKNWAVDLDNGNAIGSLTVFAAEQGDGASNSNMGRLLHFIDLALAAGFGLSLPGFDPLVLDLDGDGFDLRTERNSNVWFEFDTDGFAEHTGWAGPDDGFLVRDTNGNGKIDDITEMFGNQTVGGFDMLAGFDTNGDGVISTADSGFNGLQVWRDLDQDGVTDSGELFSLNALGIASISLTHAAPDEDESEIGGNIVSQVGNFTRLDGTTGAVGDIVLSINETNSKWMGDATIGAIAATLPNVRGSGEIRDLRVAMTSDPALQTLVASMASGAGSDPVALTAQIEEILYRWAGVDGVAPDSIGINGFNARKLAFLEKYTGYALMPRDPNGTVQLDNIGEMESMWTDQLNRFVLRIGVQGPLSDAFGGIVYKPDADTLTATTPDTLANLLHELVVDLPSDATAAATQWEAWAPLLGAVVEGMRRADGNIVRTDFLFAQLVGAIEGVTSALSLEQLAAGLDIANIRVGTAAGETLVRGTLEGTTIYYGGGGNDAINGGGGQDVYVFGDLIGDVVVNDVEAVATGDRLRFASHAADEVKLERSGNDLLITVLATGETVRVTGQFAPVVPQGSDVLLSTNKGIEDIQFADGTIFEIPQIMTAIGQGTDDADHMIGTMHSDVLIGGLADDVLEGGDDADLYVFNRGDGFDTIIDQQTTPLLRAADMFVLGDDIEPEDLVITRTGTDGEHLLITIADGGGSILVQNQFAYTSLGYNGALAPNSRIEMFAFRHYGEAWSNRNIQQSLIAASTTAADDTTRGFGDDDNFEASAGNDLLIGMDGADYYKWGTGSGNDVIREDALFIDVVVGLGGLSLTVRADTVQFTADITPEHLIFSRPTAAPDLVITNSTTGETLTIKDQFAGFQTGVLGAQWFDRIEWFAFADSSRLSWKDVTLLITTGGEEDDSLWGDVLADTLNGAAGDDTLSGLGGGDTYIFGLGDGHDTVRDDNTSLLGDGFVTIDPTPDVLRLGPGIGPGDISFVRNGTDVDLVIGANGERVTLVGQNDYFHTGVFGALSYNRIEEIRFEDGTVWTWQDLNARIIASRTTIGDDLAEGFALADRFEASAGDDVLRGGDSGDTYVFGVGAGHDRIEESVSNVLYGDDDSVEFDSTVAPADVSVARDGNDLILTLTSGDTLRVVGEFDLQTLYTWTDVENFRFADGTVWTKADIQQRLLQSTAGNDHLVGFYSGDDLDGAAGDDLLEGKDGGDTYHFDRGYGHDEIREIVTEVNAGDYDRVVFGPSLLPEDLVASRDGNDLVLTIGDTGETLRITGQFAFASWLAWNDVELFTFANGAQWTDIQVAARLTGGTSGDDHLVGTFRSDTLDGKQGNDLLEGGDGSDIYIFGRGYGQDEIRESLTDANLGEDDELRFGPDITLADLGFTRSGNDLLITILGTADTLKIAGQFNYGSWFTWQDVDRFLFDDGTTLVRQEIQQVVLESLRTSGADHILGFMTGDTLDGGAGNDILEGGDGSDTYLFGRGYGQDEIRETLTDGNLGEDDTVRFGADVNWSDLNFTRDGDALTITIAGTTDSLKIGGEWTTITDTATATWWDVENFVFADGTSKTRADIQLELLRSTSSNDHLVGFYTDDLLDGGQGDDLLEGGRGADTYLHGANGGHDRIADYVNYWGSGGDRLIFGSGITTADVEVKRSTANPNDMVLLVNGGSSSVTLANQINGGREWTLDLVEFADGTVWTAATLANLMTSGAATGSDDVIDGTSLADQLFGGGGNDTLRGLGGGDTLDGGGGNDRLEGGDGDDIYVYSPGGGDDVVSEYAYYYGSWNALTLGVGITAGDVSFARSAVDANDIVLSFAGGSVTLDNQLYGGREWGVDVLRFADGAEWDADAINNHFFATLTTNADDVIEGGGRADILAGGAGNDTLRGNGGADTLDGGGGNDRLEGGDGDDIYRYAADGGADVISEYTYYYGSWNVLEIGAGILPAGVSFSRSTADGNDIVLSFAEGGSITLDNQLYGGREWGIDVLRFANGVEWEAATINAKFFESQTTAGNDVIDGSGKDDTLLGGAGDDTLCGLGGLDRLDGGIGNDRLEGGDGDDVYIYAAGGGNDVVSEYTYYYGSYNVVELGSGLTAAEVAFSRSTDNSDLILNFSQAGGSITLDNQFYGGREWGVDLVKFADGTQWDAAALNAAFFAGQGTSADETITGSGLAETINGRGGNDVLQGLQDNDRLIGGTGNDRLVGAEGDDTFVYDPGDGNDVINDYVGWYGSTDTLIFGAGIAAADIIASRVASDGSHLRITFKNQAGSILIENQTWNDAGIERFEFANGTVLTESDVNALLRGATDGNDVIAALAAGGELWALEGNDTITGSGVADALYGQAGNDSLAGGQGNDLLVGGAGDDQIFGGSKSVGGLAITGPNLIVNGSFEQSGTVTGSGSWGKANSDLPGWSKTNSQAFEQATASNGVSPTDGSYWLDMDSAGGTGSNMDVSQSIVGLAAGQVMRLQFDHANRAGASGGMEVYWNGSLIATYGSEIGSAMVAKQFDLAAVAGTNTIRFVGTGSTNNAGASLDNVRLFATQPDGQDGGNDVAGFAGLSSEYLVTDLGNSVYEIHDLTAGRDGIDTIQNIDLLRFADGDFAPGDLTSGQAAFLSSQESSAAAPLGVFGSEWGGWAWIRGSGFRPTLRENQMEQWRASEPSTDLIAESLEDSYFAAQGWRLGADYYSSSPFSDWHFA